MLIPFQELLQYIKTPIKGVVHIGAHDCEEREAYINILNQKDNTIIWIDALKEKIQKIKDMGNNHIQIYEACISNCDDEEVHFTVTNNYASSSILELKEHLKDYPDIQQIEKRTLNTITMDTFFKKHEFEPSDYNFINLDIQGAELLALQGLNLAHIDYIYTEINVKELYKDCVLLDELDEYLNQFGFKRVITALTRAGWGDGFYIKDA